MNEAAPPTCQVRVAGQNEHAAVVSVRQQRLEIGRPLTFDEQYPAITALETFAGAVAAETINGMLLRARKRGLEIGQVEAVVKVWLRNPLTFLEAPGEESDPSIETFSVQLSVRTRAEAAAVKALLDDTLARCPLYLTLRKAAQVNVDFQIAF